jgi:hypothetical protein
MSLDITFIFAKADLRRGTHIKRFVVPPHGLQILSALTPEEHQSRLWTSITFNQEKLAQIEDEGILTIRKLRGSAQRPSSEAMQL